ncbi:MAG: ribosomal protein S18-alanine N-acetyltransferase [Chloroflexota bacterium]
MKIRLMQAEDLPAVAHIDKLCFSEPWPPAAFEYELTNTNARCWVAEQDKSQDENTQPRIIAALVIWRVLDEAHIATIAVHPDFQHQGIGRILLKTGMQAAYNEGARIYYLEVRAGNLAAQKMYTDFGFIVVSRRPNYYKDNGEDALLMTLEYKT